MNKIVMLSVGFGSSVLGFSLFLYLRKMKNKLKKKVLEGKE